MATTTAAAVFMQQEAQPAHPGERLVVPEWGEAEWSALFSHTSPVELQAGEVLIQPRGGDRSLFFVASGELEVVSMREAEGSVGPIATISAGSVVGEFAFFDGMPRSAKVWAVAPSLLLRLTPEDYRRYANEHLPAAPAFLFAMARLLAVRARGANGKI